jgi:hypothetical protein
MREASHVDGRQGLNVWRRLLARCRLAEGAAQPRSLTDGFSLAIWVAFGFAALSILATVLAIRRAVLRADVSPATAAT